MRQDKACYCWLSSVMAPLCLLLLSLLGMSGCSSNDLNFPSEYQAVFMDNGQVFYGKLQDSKSSFLLLHDVYTLKNLTDQDKRETRVVMAPRGIEAHNPDFMRINTRHVVVIEPVGPESRVAQLIREAKLAPLSRVMPPPAQTPTPGSAQTPEPPPSSQPAKGKTTTPSGR